MSNRDELSPAKAIKAARLAKNWSQTELATRVGTKQQTIEKIEFGKIKHSRYFPKIALALGLDIGELVPEMAAPQDRLIPETDLRSRDRDFPVHAAAEGGKGEIIVSSDPVSWVLRPTPLVGVSRAYGIIVVGTSMVPEFRPGDTALINPHLPPERGETYVFYAERDGETRASIKSLIKWTQTQWFVEQWNPKTRLTLPRSLWGKCHRVVGRYSK